MNWSYKNSWHWLLAATCIILACFDPCQARRRKKSEPRIAVIGAGISGLLAIDELVNVYGFRDVTLIEAHDKPGGRISYIPHISRTHSNQRPTIHLGAQYLHDYNNDLYKLCNLDLALIPTIGEMDEQTSREFEFRWASGATMANSFKYSIYDFYRNADTHIDRLAISNQYLSLGELIDVYFKRASQVGDSRNSDFDDFKAKDILAAGDFMRAEVQTSNALKNIYRTSSRTFTDNYVGTATTIHLRGSGFKTVIDYFLSRIPKKMVIYDQFIKKIDYSEGTTVALTNSEGDTVEFDHVIVTIPLGVLKTPRVQFYPPLPSNKEAAIRYMGFGTMDKVFLFYPEPWWDITKQAIMIAERDDYVPMTNKERMFSMITMDPYCTDYLIVWIGGEYNVDLLQASSDRQLMDAATRQFRRAFGRDDIPPPEYIVRSEWQMTETALGAMTSYTLQADENGVSIDDLMQPIYALDDAFKPLVQFAGEHTHDKWFGSVHGAYDTGIREARRLAKYYDISTGTREGPGKLTFITSTIAMGNMIVKMMFSG